jgi:hypothetical protein
MHMYNLGTYCAMLLSPVVVVLCLEEYDIICFSNVWSSSKDSLVSSSHHCYVNLKNMQEYGIIGYMVRVNGSECMSTWLEKIVTCTSGSFWVKQFGILKINYNFFTIRQIRPNLAGTFFRSMGFA